MKGGRTRFVDPRDRAELGNQLTVEVATLVAVQLTRRTKTAEKRHYIVRACMWMPQRRTEE